MLGNPPHPYGSSEAAASLHGVDGGGHIDQCSYWVARAVCQDVFQNVWDGPLTSMQLHNQLRVIKPNDCKRVNVNATTCQMCSIAYKAHLRI